MAQKKSRTSIVIPVHNEEKVLLELYSRIKNVGKEIDLLELIFVDDGSTDGSWKYIEKLQKRDSRVIGVRLTRNFGHQNAVLCGISKTKGSVIAIMDGDLQDPPELLPSMIKMLTPDVDIVYGQRLSRSGENLFKRITANFFYRIFQKLVPFNLPVDVGDFRVFKKHVGDIVLQSRDQYPFVRALFAHSGFKSMPFLYNRDPRFSGETKYNLRKMFALALTALLSFSEAPFRFALRIAFILLITTSIISIYAIIHAVTESSLPGWVSLFLPIIFFGSLNFLFIVLLGNYITSILGVISHRPRWVEWSVIKRQ